VPAQRPTRDEYVHWERVTTRWADIDVYGHMNNARYFEIIDTVVNNHLAASTGLDIRSLDAIGVVAEVGCRYFAEVGYPDPVDVGLVAERVGVIVDEGPMNAILGEKGATVGELRALARRMDDTDPARPVTPLPDVIRAAVSPLLRG